MSINIPFQGGSYFHPESFVHSQTIPAGQTGDLVTIGTAGKVTRLTHLLASDVFAQNGISVLIGSTEVVTVGELDEKFPANPGFIGVYRGQTTNNASITSGILDVIEGEFITIRKDAGNTTQGITYSYLTGEYK